MQKKLYGTFAFFIASFITSAQPVKIAPVFADAEKQTQVMLTSIAEAKGSKTELVAPRTLENGQLKLVPSRDWTSGFFAGELWMLYAYTRKPEWKSKAEAFTSLLEKEKMNGGTHDMGFKIYCSYGTGYQITK